MATKLDPLISEFETQEEADSYDTWLRRRVDEGITDPRPRVPHEEALIRLQGALQRGIAKRRKPS